MMQGETSLIDVSDSELTPRARTLKRKQLRRLKERTLRRRRKELFVNLSTEFAMLSRTQRRAHVAKMKQMMAEQGTQERNTVSFSVQEKEEEGASSREPEKEKEHNNEEEEEEEEEQAPTRKLNDENSLILRREISALQMKIEKLKDVADQAAKVAKDKPSSRRSTLSDVSKLLSPKDTIKGSKPSSIRRTESDRDVVQSLKPQAPEPTKVLAELDRLGEDLKNVASVLRELVVEEEKQQQARDQEKGNETEMEDELEEASRSSSRSRKRKHKSKEEGEDSDKERGERRKKRRKKHSDAADKEQRGVKRKRTRKEDTKEHSKKVTTKKPKAKHSEKEENTTAQDETPQTVEQETTQQQATRPDGSEAVQHEPEQRQRPPQHFNTLARAYTVLSDAQETRLKAAYAKQRIEQMYRKRNQEEQATQQPKHSTETSSSTTRKVPSAVVRKPGAPSQCREKGDQKHGGDDNKENDEGGAKAAVLHQGKENSKRPARIQRQPRQRNLKKIFQDRLPDFHILKGTKRIGKKKSNEDEPQHVTVVSKVKERQQGYRNESFYSSKRSEINIFAPHSNHSVPDDNDNKTNNHSKVHNHSRNEKHTHNNSNTADKENIENIPQAPPTKATTTKRAMPLTGGMYDEPVEMKGTLRERNREEENKRREMAKRQASLVMQKRGTLRSLKKLPIDSSSSTFYYPNTQIQKTATIRR